MNLATTDLSTFTLISHRLIMTADLNAGGKLFGGKLLAWVDEAAALFCMVQLGTRHIVTKKISEVIFNEPAQPGDILEFHCRTKSIGRTSITVECVVPTKKISKDDVIRNIVHCELVFVAIDKNGRPVPHGISGGQTHDKGTQSK